MAEMRAAQQDMVDQAAKVRAALALFLPPVNLGLDSSKLSLCERDEHCCLSCVNISSLTPLRLSMGLLTCLLLCVVTLICPCLSCHL